VKFLAATALAVISTAAAYGQAAAQSFPPPICLKPDGTQESCLLRQCRALGLDRCYEPPARRMEPNPPQTDITKLHSGAYTQPIVYPNWKPLPPLEYDFPYEGKLLIVRSEADLPDFHMCPKPEPGRYILGCAIRYRNADGSLMKKCDIYIAPESLIGKYGLSFEDALRHEMAHCNGWPGHHPGMRPLGTPRRGPPTS
jgi:hypothetical protein